MPARWRRTAPATTRARLRRLFDAYLARANTADRIEQLEKKQPASRVLVLAAAYSGARIGELLALTRADVDLLHGTLNIDKALKDIHGKDTEDWSEGERGLIIGPTKTKGSTRKVRIPGFLVRELEAHLGAIPPAADALLFAGARGGPMRHRLWYARQFKPAVRAALPAKANLRFQDLRHTCASLLIAAGANAKAVSAQLGHSSVTITLDRYTHLFPDAYDDLTARLEETCAAAQAGPSNVTPIRKTADA